MKPLTLPPPFKPINIFIEIDRTKLTCFYTIKYLLKDEEEVSKYIDILGEPVCLEQSGEWCILEIHSYNI